MIRIDVSIGNMANRLAVSTTINQDLTEIIAAQEGLGRIFGRAIAIRFVGIAVRYRRDGRDSEETLEFTLTDGNTSSLMSLDDPFERHLGHRLLRCWGILREGRSPSKAESREAIPALLELWDIGADKVTGAWLADRGIDTDLLTDLGFLVPVGWEDEDLVDEGDGPEDAEIAPRPGGAAGGEGATTQVDLTAIPGQETPSVSPERYRVYRVRDGWVAQHLRDQVTGVLDSPAVEEVNAPTSWRWGHSTSTGAQSRSISPVVWIRSACVRRSIPSYGSVMSWGSASFFKRVMGSAPVSRQTS